MPQSLSRLHVHLIFSTKNRTPYITDSVRSSLHAYMATVLKNLGCAPIIINSVEYHIHLLFDLSRTVTVSKVVEDVKKSSSKWIKTQAPELQQFAWQSGYGVFAVSESDIESVRSYIANQQKHHSLQTFQDEFRVLLQKHRIPFDEQYLWG